MDGQRPRGVSLHHTWQPMGRRWILLFGALLLAYLALRLPHLDALPPFTDETDYIWDALLVGGYTSAHAWDGLFVSLHDGVPPLFPWVLALLQRLPLDPLIAARLLSTIAGAGTLLILYATGCAWGSVRAGFLAAAAYIVCPLTLFTDRMGLLDGMLAFWVLATGVLAWIACGPGPPAARRWTIGAGFCLGAALLTKSIAILAAGLPLFAYLFPAQGPPFPQKPQGSGETAGEDSRPGNTRERRLAVEVIYMIALVMWSVLLLSGRVPNLLYPFHLQSAAGHSGWSAGRLLVTLSAVGRYGLRYLTPPLSLVLALSLLWTLPRARGPARYLALWICLAGSALILTAGPFFPPRYLAFLVPPLLLCGSLTVDHFPRRWGKLAALGILVAGVTMTIWAIPFDRALLLDPRQAPFAAVDRMQYITGWPAGYGLMEALSTARRLGGSGFTLDTSAVDPPFDQAQILFHSQPHIVIVPVAVSEHLTCGHTATYLLLDTPRDDERAFRRANGQWRRIAAFGRPDSGGAYVLYHCLTATQR